MEQSLTALHSDTVKRTGINLSKQDLVNIDLAGIVLSEIVGKKVSFNVILKRAVAKLAEEYTKQVMKGVGGLKAKDRKAYAKWLSDEKEATYLVAGKKPTK